MQELDEAALGQEGCPIAVGCFAEQDDPGVADGPGQRLEIGVVVVSRIAGSDPGRVLA